MTQGQAYTAISRVTSKEGLQLTNYTARRYVADNRQNSQLTYSAKVDRVAVRWVRELEGDEDYESYVEQPDY